MASARSDGSVRIKKQYLKKTTFVDSYIGTDLKRTEIEKSFEDMNDHVHVDQSAASQRMRMLFKNAYKEEGCCATFMLFISIPLNFIRDYTIPIGEIAVWDRRRASIIPITQVAGFFYMNLDL